ncbi:MAG: hypothetical protein KTR33_12890 [Gammaproteobacteria bacterium]|nr:hypothetical protein [Gammaproteobacteria bacterium]
MHPENVSDRRWQQFLVKARNELAVILSVIPGLGHIYKGYYLMGAGLILLTPVMLFAGLLAGAMTLGLGLLIPVLFWAGTAVSAFMIEDHRKHHLFH